MKYPELTFDPFFTWQIRTRIMYSPDVRKEVGYEISQLGGTKVAIFTDQGLIDAGVAEMLIQTIQKTDLKIAGVFDRILQGAQIDIINEGAAFYRTKGADCMIALGGGSVMDSAKAINILVGDGKDDFGPLAAQCALWDGAKPLPPHIAFPTTAGTACEVTNGMVVLDVEAQARTQVTHPYCVSDLAMLDPELSMKLPAKITAFTGMDALTHAIEGVTSTCVEPIGDALGLHAIRLAFRYLPIVVKEPDNVTARGNMLIASTLAGMCSVNTMMGAVHALAHSLGDQFGIPHGLANAIMLPEVMAFNLEERADRFLVIADAMGLAVDGLDPLAAGKMVVQAIRDLKREIGLTETLKDFSVPTDRDALLPLLDLASCDGQLSYNPRMLDEDDIYNLYMKAM